MQWSKSTLFNSELNWSRSTSSIQWKYTTKVQISQNISQVQYLSKHLTPLQGTDFSNRIQRCNYQQLRIKVGYRISYAEALRKKYDLVKSEWSSSHASTCLLFTPSSNLVLRVFERGFHSGEKNQLMSFTISGAVTVSLRKDSSVPAAQEGPGVVRSGSMHFSDSDWRHGIPSLKQSEKRSVKLSFFTW